MHHKAVTGNQNSSKLQIKKGTDRVSSGFKTIGFMLYLKIFNDSIKPENNFRKKTIKENLRALEISMIPNAFSPILTSNIVEMREKA